MISRWLPSASFFPSQAFAIAQTHARSSYSVKLPHLRHGFMFWNQRLMSVIARWPMTACPLFDGCVVCVALSVA